MTIQNQIGKKIRHLRKAKSLTQEQLGEKSGISYKYLGEIERGEVNPRINILEKIALGLEVGTGDLFQEKLFYLTIEEVKTAKSALAVFDKLFNKG